MHKPPKSHVAPAKNIEELPKSTVYLVTSESITNVNRDVTPKTNDSTSSGDIPAMEDTTAYVALLGAWMEDSKEEGEVVCQQPSNSAGVNDGDVVVAGEILSGPSTEIPLDPVVDPVSNCELPSTTPDPGSQV